jgi:hypothetical protein
MPVVASTDSRQLRGYAHYCTGGVTVSELNIHFTRKQRRNLGGWTRGSVQLVA